MKNAMRVLAQANGWEMVLDLNSCITLHHGRATYLVSSAIEGLREIPDMETRTLMAKQIFSGGI